MTTNAILRLCCGLIVPLFLSGCLFIGNRGPHQAPGPTLGQQLQDLQKAKEAGALTEDEFQIQKTRLLGRR